MEGEAPGGDRESSDQSKEHSLRGAEADVGSGAARASTLPEDLRHLPERERAQRLSLRKIFADQEHGLRQRYADWIISILVAQMVVADGVFVTYAWAGSSWNLTPGVIEVWLGATVVQVVGIVLIVTRHLFPSRDGQPTAL